MSRTTSVLNNSLAAQSLRHMFTPGSTVTVTITSHRIRTRTGAPKAAVGEQGRRAATEILVMATMDNRVVNVSGHAASVTGYNRIAALIGNDESTRVLVRGLDDPFAAAHQLVADVSLELYGDDKALSVFVV